MNITINDILKMKPCDEGIEELYSVIGASYDKDKPLDIELLVSKLSLFKLCWVLGQLDKKEILVKLAIFSAAQVLHIYESKHDSNAPRLAIKVAEAWVKVPTKHDKFKAKATCAAAAHAASAAAYATDGDADDEAYAACAAAAAHYAASATYAAHAAAHAADAADAADDTYAARSAAAHYAASAAHYAASAASAASAATPDRILDKQIRAYLLTLLIGEEL